MWTWERLSKANLWTIEVPLLVYYFYFLLFLRFFSLSISFTQPSLTQVYTFYPENYVRCLCILIFNQWMHLIQYTFSRSKNSDEILYSHSQSARQNFHVTEYTIPHKLKVGSTYSSFFWKFYLEGEESGILKLEGKNNLPHLIRRTTLLEKKFNLSYIHLRYSSGKYCSAISFSSWQKMENKDTTLNSRPIWFIDTHPSALNAPFSIKIIITIKLLWSKFFLYIFMC